MSAAVTPIDSVDLKLGDADIDFQVCPHLNTRISNSARGSSTWRVDVLCLDHAIPILTHHAGLLPHPAPDCLQFVVWTPWTWVLGKILGLFTSIVRSIFPSLERGLNDVLKGLLNDNLKYMAANVEI